MKRTEFLALLIPAAEEALTERQRAIFFMRFGLDGVEPEKLETIAKRLGRTRERIRQILATCTSKIVVRGKRELKNGETDRPCARLLEQLAAAVGMNEEVDRDRLEQFITRELRPVLSLAYALPLVVPLVVHDSPSARELKKALQMRHSPDE